MLDDSSPWVTFGALRAYRYVRFRSPWPPDAEYNDSSGRFNNGIRFTLYVADDVMGATAEFYRRNPEFLDDQSIADIRVFALDLVIPGRCLDVRTQAYAHAVGVTFDRLRSNDSNEAVRYAECRALAEVVEPLGCGIAFPSAAYVTPSPWCLVLFGRPSNATWRCASYTEIATPIISPSEVRQVPA